MSSPPYDREAGHRLLWSLRHHRTPVAIVALLILLGTALAVWRVLDAPTRYTATATILGGKLAHDPASLGRLAETLAADPLVLADAVALESLPYSTSELAEDHSEVRPLEDNVLVLVDGIDDDPELAIRASNALAKALSAELNRAGDAVGNFRVLTRATVAEPAEVGSTVLLYAAGGLVALVAGVLATVGLLNALRRPIDSPAAASAAAGAPVLVVIDGNEWPTRARLEPFTALTASLRERRAHQLLVLGPPGYQALTERVTVAFSRFLERPEHGSSRGAAMTVSTPAIRPGGTSSVPVPSGAKAVVVAPEGVPTEQLVQAAQRVGSGDLAGVLYIRSPRRVRPAKRQRRSRQRSADESAAATASATAPITPPATPSTSPAATSPAATSSSSRSTGRPATDTGHP